MSNGEEESAGDGRGLAAAAKMRIVTLLGWGILEEGSTTPFGGVP